MKRNFLTGILSMTILLGIAMPVHAEEVPAGAYVTDENGVSFSMTKPTTEEEKASFGWALMAEGTLNLYQQAKAAGRYFDPAYYAANNPDVVEALGDEPWVLYYHYRVYGLDEGRLPYEGGTAGIDGIANWDLSRTEVVIKMLARQEGISEEEEWKRSYGGNIPWYATNAGIEAEIARRQNAGIQ